MRDLIIYGYSKTSYELAKILTEKKRKFTIVSFDEKHIDEAIRDGHETHFVDLSHDNGLLEIGIGKSVKTLFCMNSDYNKNLFVTLSARNLDRDLNIISLVSTLNEESKMLLAGATHVVNPYDLGSHRIYRLLQKPMVFDVLDSMIFLNQDIKIDELEVPKDSPIIGIEFQKLTVEKDYDLVLIGIQSGKTTVKFYYNTHKIYRKIKEGDVFVIAGNAKDIERFKKGLQP